jgi:hypothetical protein
MNPIHVHLLLNHIPVLGTLFGCILLLYALLRRNSDYSNVALGVFVILALITPIVFFSGDKSVDRVEKISGVLEKAIDAHDEAAEGAFAAIEGLGVLSLLQLLLGFIPSLQKQKSKLAWLTALGAALAFGWVAYAANLGGQIRHAEELQSLGLKP